MCPNDEAVFSRSAAAHPPCQRVLRLGSLMTIPSAFWKVYLANHEIKETNMNSGSALKFRVLDETPKRHRSVTFLASSSAVGPPPTLCHSPAFLLFLPADSHTLPQGFFQICKMTPKFPLFVSTWLYGPRK